jgi:large subunit ribosomal protein L4
MEVSVFTIEGKDTGRKINLQEDIFSIAPNDHAIYLDVKQHLANKRQGTHKSKERSEITGSTRKVKRQKGTGTARFGDIKNPLFKGGGRVFGPRVRDYSFKLNKKVKQLARKSALSYKAIKNEIIVLEDFSFEMPKTKNYVSLLNSLKINDKKSLMILGEQNKNIYLSSQNLKNARVLTLSETTTYDIMNTSALLLLESSVNALQNKA